MFIQPTLNETIDGVYSVIFAAVTDAIAHQLELSVNGGADWTVLDDNILTAPNAEGNIVWPWDTVSLGNVSGVQLRARAILPDPTDDYTAAVLGLGPTAHYQFQEATGDVAHDVSGNENHGVYVGSRVHGEPSIIDGSPLTTVRFTGGWVECPLFDLALRSFTILAWLEVQAVPGHLVSYCATTAIANRNLQVRFESNNVLNLDYGGNATGTDSTLPVWVNGRHFVGFRYDATIDRSDIFIDAVVKGNVPTAGPLNVNGLRFKLFGSVDGAGGDDISPFFTRAQHISIFAGTALTGAQILGLNNLGAP